jgi:phosphoribosylformylglycinamidine synthase
VNLGGSRFLKVCFGIKQGPVPALDLDHEIAIQNAVRELIRAGLIRSAHDCSEGGMGVALAECCFNPAGSLGANITLRAKSDTETNESIDIVTAALFAETQSRILISVSPGNLQQALGALTKANVPHQQLGKVGGEELSISVARRDFRWNVAEIYDDWWNAIRRAVEQDESIPSL